MERLTEQHYKKADGFYMKCSEHCCRADAFGKTVFLPREETEAALRREQG